MQTEEIIRSAVLCMENNAIDDPRCLAAAQELYNVVSSLNAKEIKTLTTTPEQEEERRRQAKQKQHQHQQQYQNHQSRMAQQSNNKNSNNNNTNNSRTGSVTFADQQQHQQQAQQEKLLQQSTKSTSNSRSASAATTTSSSSAATSAISTSSSKDTEALLGSLPPHLVGFAADVPPPLHIRSLIQLAIRCYSGVAGFQHPSPTVEHVAQVTLVTLRLCVAADAVHDLRDVQLLSELALQLGAGRTDSVPTSTATAYNHNNNNSASQQRSRSGGSSSSTNHSSSTNNNPISTVSVLAAIELFMVSLYNNRLATAVTDAALSASSRHWLSAWLIRIEDGSASQPIEIFHRLCCFQRIITLRPTAASNVFAAQGFHERLIRFVCGDGAAVHASSIGLALHLLAQMVEDGPENIMMKFVTPKLIELHISSWSASEWTETLEGAFVLLTACIRLGLNLDLWRSIVHANLHLVCSHAIASPSVRVGAAAATCLRTMLFMCQRDLDIGLSVFFDTLASPNIFRVLDNHGGTNLMNNNNNNNHNKSNSNNNNNDVTGLRILTTECALIVAVFASFSPQHKVTAHHIANKLHFPLSMQRALLTMNDADLSLFVSWTLFDEAGRSISGVDDQQFNMILKTRPLSHPPPGTTPQEWTDAAYVKYSLQKALQPPSESDVASIFGFLTMNSNNNNNISSSSFPTSPKPPALGSKELSLALLKWFSTPLQIVAATEGKTNASNIASSSSSHNRHHYQVVPTKHHQQASSSFVNFQQDGDYNNNGTDDDDPSNFAKDHFESCVNLIVRFAKCAPVTNGSEDQREAFGSPQDTTKKRKNTVHGNNRTIMNNNNHQQTKQIKLHVDPVSLQRNRTSQQQVANNNNNSNVNDASFASSTNHVSRKLGVNTSMQKGAAVSMVSSNTTGRKATVASSSRPSNESGLRRTHLFSHPYIDYYMNAQKKNAYTPIPTIPPQVRRWDLDDIQKGDLFSFQIRLDGLEQLIMQCGRLANSVEKSTDDSSHQQEDVDNSGLSGATTNDNNNSISKSRTRKSRATTATTKATPESALMSLHRETPASTNEEDDYYTDEDEDENDAEEYEEEVEEEVEEEIEESDDNDDEFSVDDGEKKKPRYATHVRTIQKIIRREVGAASTSSSTAATPSVVPPSDAIPNNNKRKQVSQELFSSSSPAATSSSSKRRRIIHQRNNKNLSANKKSSRNEPVVDEELLSLEKEREKEAHNHLQQRVTTLLADALRRAELHTLKMNEKSQCCPVKMLNRRAFLVDMVNNVMPAIISMLTMLFSVAKRAPAAIVRVARRVERSEAAMREGSYHNNNNHNLSMIAGLNQTNNNQQQQLQQHESPGYSGSITIHPGNICAVCFQLEMELAWY